MPPYTAPKSEAQRRLFFAKANRGEMSMREAVGKSRAAKGKALPERVRRKSRKRSR